VNQAGLECLLSPSVLPDKLKIEPDESLRPEFLVAREGGMNVLASPTYLEAGGTIID
jgi:hypothetical protein